MSDTRRRQGWPARQGWQAMVLAIVMLLVGAVSANATTVTYSGDGTYIVTGGDNANHELQFRLDAVTGGDDILDNQEITEYPGTARLSP